MIVFALSFLTMHYLNTYTHFDLIYQAVPPCDFSLRRPEHWAVLHVCVRQTNRPAGMMLSVCSTVHCPRWITAHNFWVVTHTVLSCVPIHLPCCLFGVIISVPQRNATLNVLLNPLSRLLRMNGKSFYHCNIHLLTSVDAQTISPYSLVY